MHNKKLDEIINNEFSFLFQELNFRSIHYGYDSKMFGNEGFDISNGKTMVSFQKDRGQLLIDIGYPQLQRMKWYDLSIIIKAKTGENINVYKFDEKNLSLTTEEQAKNLSPLMKKYCIEILQGNWSLEPKIIETRTKWGKEALQKLGLKKSVK